MLRSPPTFVRSLVTGRLTVLAANFAYSSATEYWSQGLTPTTAVGAQGGGGKRASRRTGAKVGGRGSSTLVWLLLLLLVLSTEGRRLWAENLRWWAESDQEPELRMFAALLVCRPEFLTI